MTNHPRKQRPLAPPPRIDAPFGFCLVCLSERKAAEAATGIGELPDPFLAVTMAPTMIPIPSPDGRGIIGVGVVAVPSCYQHLAGGGQEQRKPLLVASGSMGV